MGKVFEALSKAEVEREAEDTREEMEATPCDRYSRDGRFSFVRYSLGAASTADKDRSRGWAAALVRRSQAEPREISIKPGVVDPHLVSLYNFNRQACDQYNKLALSLISKSAERGLKRLLIASAETGEGRTTVALNLACSLARARQRALVIDCDFANPGIARALGIDCDIGLAEAFVRGLPAAAAAVRIRPYQFDVVPIRKRVENSVELMAAPAFWKMLQAFDEYYDFILFDSSPLLSHGDASLLVRFTDTTLLVVQAGRIGAAGLDRAMSPFTRDDILGVVINRAVE